MHDERRSILISYSHRDDKSPNQFLTHLKPLERSIQITPWSDRQIQPGQKWMGEINAALASAKIAEMKAERDRAWVAICEQLKKAMT